MRQKNISWFDHNPELFFSEMPVNSHPKLFSQLRIGWFHQNVSARENYGGNTSVAGVDFAYKCCALFVVIYVDFNNGNFVIEQE
jgi:hypothetical protein